MSFRYVMPAASGTAAHSERASIGYEHKRRAIATDRLGAGTLACPRCDAPVAIGPGSLSVAARLACPFCATSGPLRDFLSMAAPTRPARVVVRVAVRRG